MKAWLTILVWATACSSQPPGDEMRSGGFSPTTASERTAERSGSPDRDLTTDYLTGEWCFHRETGGGERGIIVFEPDGTHRSGIVWIEDVYRLEEPQDLEMFRRSYPSIVEIEPDRFVGLLSGHYRVVFERAPC